MVKIQSASLVQAAEIAELYVRTRRLAYSSFFPPEALAAMSVDEETKRWAERLAGDGVTCVAVAEERDLLGFTHIDWQGRPEDDVPEVAYVYVAKEHQGEGLGRRLITDAEAAIVGRGYTAAVLWVYEANMPARRFYERCGWFDDGARRASNSAPGECLARYRIVLPVGDLS
jgi:GNAT superfamily N-acetyltransferase